MATKRGRLALELLPGVLFILAGLRDFFLPGFLSMAGRRDSDGTTELCVGAAWLVIFLAKWRRATAAPAGQD
jgi:hypothetical protein